MEGIIGTAASFAISLIANNIPTIKDIISNKSLDKRIIDCYNQARKELPCKAVRDKYEGKEFLHFDELKDYIKGNLEDIDPELKILLSRWALKMQNDPICSAYINTLKADEILAGAKEYPALFVEILAEMSSITIQLVSIQSSLNHQEEALEKIQSGNDNIIDHIKILLQQTTNIPGVNRKPIDIDSILERYMNESVSKKPITLEPVPTCTSAMDTRMSLFEELIEESAVFDHLVWIPCCRGGLSWFTNENVRLMMYKTQKKIETFSNVNRYYLSEEAYGMMRQHIISAERLCDAIEVFVATLNRGYEQLPDEFTAAIDSVSYGEIQISPEYISTVMDVFNSVYPSQAFRNLSIAYSKHYLSRKAIVDKIDKTREYAF